VLPYAQWSRFWAILILIPGLNIFFLWIFAFAPWKRRYIPLSEDEPSELSGRVSEARPATGRPVTQSATMMAGATRPRTGPAETMLQGKPAHGRTGPAETIIQGKSARGRSGVAGGHTIVAGADDAPPPASESGHQTMLAGSAAAQPLDEPVAPGPPIPQRSRQKMSAEPPPPPAPEPPRKASTRTHDLSHPQPGGAEEAATMRVAAEARPGGRAWRLVGANDVAAAIDFTIHEAALIEAENGFLIGRSARAHLVVEHDSVSRNHARFLLDKGLLCVEDLDSMNGTWVDERKLEANVPVPLKPNGIVEFGKVKLRVTGG
jgi:hypothetical protein